MREYRATECEFYMNRDLYQSLFNQAFEDAGFTHDGHPDHPKIQAISEYKKNAGSHTVMPSFIITTEDWSEDGPWNEWPKYIDIEKDIVIDWYKYPLRAGRSNKRLPMKTITDSLNRFVAEAQSIINEQ